MARLKPNTAKRRSKLARSRKPPADLDPFLSLPLDLKPKAARSRRDLLGEFRQEMLADAITLGRQGATDFEVAQAFGVSPAVITYWRSKDPDFDRALRVHAEVADDRVERALFHKATGYSFHAEKIHISADGVVTRVPYIEHVPPDNTAMIFWLKNRQRDKWRDVQQVEAKVDGEIRHTVDAKQVALGVLAALRNAAEQNAKTIEHSEDQ